MGRPAGCARTYGCSVLCVTVAGHTSRGLYSYTPLWCGDFGAATTTAAACDGRGPAGAAAPLPPPNKKCGSTPPRPPLSHPHRLRAGEEGGRRRGCTVWIEAQRGARLPCDGFHPDCVGSRRGHSRRAYRAVAVEFFLLFPRGRAAPHSGAKSLSRVVIFQKNHRSLLKVRK